MRHEHWTRRRVPSRAVVQIFAVFGVIVCLAAPEGWQVHCRVAAALRAEGALYARFQEDPRFADLRISRTTGGSITVSGTLPSTRDLLDLRSVVQSTAPATPAGYSIHVGGKWVTWFPQPDRFRDWVQHDFALLPNARD